MSAVRQPLLVVCYSHTGRYEDLSIRTLIGAQRKIILVDAYSPIFRQGLLGAAKRVGRLLRKRPNSWSDWMTAEHLKQRLIADGFPAEKISVGLANRRQLKKLSVTEFSRVWRGLLSNIAGKSQPIELGGVEASAYLFDSLQRSVSGFRVERGVSLTNIILAAVYLASAIRIAAFIMRLIDAEAPSKILINHQPYFESGWIAAYGLGQRIPVKLALVGGKTGIATLEKANTPYLIKIASGKYLSGKHSGGQGTPPPFWYEETGIQNIEDLRRKPFDDSLVTVFLHRFADDNFLFPQDSLFPSFFHWTAATLEIAKVTPATKFIFRVHPSATAQTDSRILQRLFRDTPPNVSLEYPDLRQDVLKAGGHRVVTARGSIALELACGGLRAITVATPPTTPEGGFLRATTLHQYRTYLQDGVPQEFLIISDKVRQRSLNYKSSLGFFFDRE